jgi:hypothetical protein
MKKLVFTLFMLFVGIFTYAQSTIDGTVVDQDTKEPLIGASVLLTGSSTGTVTDIDGKFTLKTDQTSGTIEISYTGYETMRTSFDGSVSLGTVELGVSAFGLDEVVVTGVMDIVRDRRTPVAVSTITTAEIQAKGGNVEFPELMKATPSIYVANQAGGYGDSEVFTRGFDQTNTAFLLNGQPINGMEDGKMYWSNWSGMTDVATAVQVQRGLGSSKLAISSVGGTTNIIMRPTSQKQGGSVSYLLGNDAYNKITATYNTGMMNDKFGMSVLFTHWQGDGWAEGTKGQGQNYFISAGYKANERNTFSFLITGAPQYHDQNFRKRISDHFDSSGDFNIKHNGNWGTLNGEYMTSRRNFYHKPVANLNWEFNIDDDTKFSTVLYASWGNGGGTGGIGSRSNRFFTSDGQWDFDKIFQANQEDAGSEEYVIRGSVNNHNWYGAVANFEKQLSETLTLSVGADLRTYYGDHFRQVVDLLGAPAYTQRGSARYAERDVTATFKANPWSAITKSAEGNERIAYSNAERISYGGLFGQLEYNTEKFTAYGQAAISNQSHVRFEQFYETEANEESEKVNNLGYNIKGGFSVSPNANNSFFFNTGYYQRQPFHDNIYLNFSNFVNPVTQSEKIFGLEAGWKYSSRKFAANVNVYRTSWKNRTNTSTIDNDEEVDGRVFPNGGFINLTNLNQLHSGIELDFKAELTSKIDLKGFASLGSWEYADRVIRNVYDDERNLVSSNPDLDIDGIKVGGAAQTSFGLGADFKLTEGLKLDADYYFFDKLYSRIGAAENELELPSYGLLDLGLSYNINMANGNLLTFRANVFNATGKEYISIATSAIEASAVESENWNGINKRNFVAFGKTRTWNISAKYSF